MTRYLELATAVASESTHPRHQLGAVVVKGGAVLAKAANTGRIERCAERRALKQRGCFKGSTVYVMRSNRLCSKPCPGCVAKLKAEGVRCVVYVDANGAVVKDGELLL